MQDRYPVSSRVDENSSNRLKQDYCESQYQGHPITATRWEIPVPVLQKIEMMVLVVVAQVTRLTKTEKAIECSTPIMT